MPESDLRSAGPATVDTVRRSFAPDPAAVERIVNYALAPRRRRHRGPWIVSLVLALVAAAMLWRARPATEIERAGLSNHGDVYVSRTAAGTRIHNNPQLAFPTETRTFQIIWTGDVP